MSGISLWLGVDTGPQRRPAAHRRVGAARAAATVAVALAEVELVAEAHEVEVDDRVGARRRSSDDDERRPRQTVRARPVGSSIVQPPSVDGGEDHHHQRRHQQVAVDDRQPGDADQHERASADDQQHRAACRARRGTSTSGQQHAGERGVDHRRLVEVVEERPRRLRHRREPVRAAELLGQALVECSENSGSPVTTPSIDRPDHRADRRERRRTRCASATASCAARRTTASTGRSAATPPGACRPASVSRTNTGAAAPRPLGLQRGGPDHEGQVRDVDVAAGGQEREVEAACSSSAAGDQADQRRERRRGQPVERRRPARRTTPSVAKTITRSPPVAEQRQHRAEDERQRVLGRRAVDLEATAGGRAGSPGPTCSE